MELEEWVKKIPAFNSMTVAAKMVAIGYYLHTVKNKEKFVVGDINLAFDALHMARPTNATSQLKGLTTGFVKRLLHDSKGYRLTATARAQVEKLLPAVSTPKQTAIDLRALEAQVIDPHQKTFLDEAIICFENKAHRASIVMAWNLAYHHACAYVLSRHVAAFNTQLAKAYPKKKAITKHSDFEDLKESEVIEVGKGAQIFSKATAGTLDANLTIRNSAAHPSSTVISPIKAEAVIDDLVKNIILRATL